MTLPADANRGIQQRDVDLFSVHHPYARSGIVAAGGAALFVGIPPRADHLVWVHLHATEGGEPIAHDFERFAVEQQDLISVCIPFYPNCTVAVARREVFQPGIARFEDVAIGIHGRRR